MAFCQKPCFPFFFSMLHSSKQLSDFMCISSHSFQLLHGTFQSVSPTSHTSTLPVEDNCNSLLLQIIINVSSHALQNFSGIYTQELDCWLLVRAHIISSSDRRQLVNVVDPICLFSISAQDFYLNISHYFKTIIFFSSLRVQQHILGYGSIFSCNSWLFGFPLFAFHKGLFGVGGVATLLL